MNTAEVRCSVTRVEIQAEESQITAHDVPFQGGYGWQKRPIAQVSTQLSELVEEKRHGLARGNSCFCLFLGDRDKVFFDRRMGCRVTRGQPQPIA